MSKNILILSGSPRKGGNSDLLCDEFMRGAREAGHRVKKIRVAEKKIGYCSGCYHCEKSGGVCAKKDDMADILQKIIDADVLVLASPVYFYSIDAQLKALIDRTRTRSSTTSPRVPTGRNRRRSGPSSVSAGTPPVSKGPGRRESSMRPASIRRGKSRILPR